MTHMMPLLHKVTRNANADVQWKGGRPAGRLRGRKGGREGDLHSLADLFAI